MLWILNHTLNLDSLGKNKLDISIIFMIPDFSSDDVATSPSLPKPSFTSSTQDTFLYLKKKQNKIKLYLLTALL